VKSIGPGARGGSEVINLNFHGIGTPTRSLEPGELQYWIDRDSFLAILDEFHYRMDVRLSFDDGNASDVDVALPALAERGMEADFFIVASRLGKPGSVDTDGVRALVAWDEPSVMARTLRPRPPSRAARCKAGHRRGIRNNGRHCRSAPWTV
jgi:hypothetical protein